MFLYKNSAANIRHFIKSTKLFGKNLSEYGQKAGGKRGKD